SPPRRTRPVRAPSWPPCRFGPPYAVRAVPPRAPPVPLRYGLLSSSQADLLSCAGDLDQTAARRREPRERAADRGGGGAPAAAPRDRGSDAAPARLAADGARVRRDAADPPRGAEAREHRLADAAVLPGRRGVRPARPAARRPARARGARDRALDRHAARDRGRAARARPDKGGRRRPARGELRRLAGRGRAPRPRAPPEAAAAPPGARPGPGAPCRRGRGRGRRRRGPRDRDAALRRPAAGPRLRLHRRRRALGERVLRPAQARRRAARGLPSGTRQARLAFTTFPMAFRGSSSTNTTSRGRLCGASRRPAWATSSASPAAGPSRRTTHATTRSPRSASGRPRTAASATAGCSSSALSTSPAPILKPPLLIRSVERRPTSLSSPPGPRVARSPVRNQSSANAAAV